MDMTITASLDITARELGQYFRNYRNAHPQQDDYGQLMADACAARWPLSTVDQCCRDAFRNSLKRDDEDAIRDSAAQSDTWVTTHPNGDLFADSMYEMPRMFLVDGKRLKYYEISLTRARAWYAAREQAKRTDAKAFEAARREAEQDADQAARMVKQCDRDIARATKAGLDPDQVPFEKVD